MSMAPEISPYGELTRSKDRIARLEQLLLKLVDALSRQGTEQDGAWGYDSFGKELLDIKADILKDKG